MLCLNSFNTSISSHWFTDFLLFLKLKLASTGVYDNYYTPPCTKYIKVIVLYVIILFHLNS